MAVPGVNKTGQWEGRSRLRNLKTGQESSGLHLHVSRENAAGRAVELPGHRASRRGGLQSPAGKPDRGPGAEEFHSRIIARSDHHHQSRGGDHRVQSGRGADLRPLPREGAGHAAFRRALPALAQRRAPQPHRALPGSGRGIDARQARGSDGLAGQRRGVPRRVGHDHRPDQRRAGADLFRPRHQLPQEGRRGAGPLCGRTGAFQPRSGAVRLRGLARPAGAAAQDPRLRRPAGSEVQGSLGRNGAGVRQPHAERRRADAGVDRGPVDAFPRHPPGPRFRAGRSGRDRRSRW